MCRSIFPVKRTQLCVVEAGSVWLGFGRGGGWVGGRERRVSQRVDKVCWLVLSVYPQFWWCVVEACFRVVGAGGGPHLEIRGGGGGAVPCVHFNGVGWRNRFGAGLCGAGHRIRRRPSTRAKGRQPFDSTQLEVTRGCGAYLSTWAVHCLRDAQRQKADGSVTDAALHRVQQDTRKEVRKLFERACRLDAGNAMYAAALRSWSETQT